MTRRRVGGTSGAGWGSLRSRLPWRQAVAVVVCSGLLTVFSESFYWYAGGTGYPDRVVFYLIPTTALLWAISRWPGSGWPVVVSAGAVYGFVTEGVLTSVVYGGFPFDPFAISYTSLAWHAIISVGFGLVLLHRLLAGGSVAGAVAAISLFGVAWGVWAMTLRLPPGADHELPALSLLVGHVELGVFAGHTVAATAVVGVCHLLLGRFVRPGDLVVGRGWRILILTIGLAWFAFLVVPAAPWAPVELVVLLAVCGWGLARSRTAALGPPVAVVVCEPVPSRHLGRLAGEPVVATQTLLGWALFIAALVSVRRSRRA